MAGPYLSRPGARAAHRPRRCSRFLSRRDAREGLRWQGGLSKELKKKKKRLLRKQFARPEAKALLVTIASRFSIRGRRPWTRPQLPRGPRRPKCAEGPDAPRGVVWERSCLQGKVLSGNCVKYAAGGWRGRMGTCWALSPCGSSTLFLTPVASYHWLAGFLPFEVESLKQFAWLPYFAMWFLIKVSPNAFTAYISVNFLRGKRRL